MIKLPSLSFLRTVKVDGFPEFGQKLYEALLASQGAHNQVEQQGNFNLSGQPLPPPQLSGMNVSADNGIFHVSLFHAADFYRGARYHVEYASDPNFGNPFPLPMHDSREWRGALGGQKLYFRASTSYGTSATAPWIYHGGAQPVGVSGGGPAGPSLPTLSQGSGTGFPGQGLQGPGQLQFRGAAPPVRKAQ